MNRTLIIVLIILIFTLFCCCICFILVAAGGMAFQFAQDEEFSWDLDVGPPTETPVVLRPTLQPTEYPLSIQPTAESQTNSNESSPKVEPVEHALVPLDTLHTLEDAVIPPNDLIGLAGRLQGRENIPLTMAAPASPLLVGSKDVMWVTNVDTNDNIQIDVTLQYATEHVYFWIEDGIYFDESDLAELVETFEAEIYPTNRDFFGSEWTPGVDGDPHLYIIYAGDLGRGLAGYFSSADENHPLAHEYSNAHEAFVLNADNLGLSSDFTLGVLAHEFQHMIHWFRDRNESSWLNEGFSELAAFINGYDVGGFDYLYTSDPDLQLNDWPNDPSATTPHYGAAFLFVDYFLDRFGDDATKTLIGHQDNGMGSVDAVLDELNITDPLTGKPIRADDVFIDWVLASYLKDGSITDGRYTYHNYPNAPSPSPVESIYTCPSETLTRDVHQYGVDYIRIACPGTYNLHFEGSIQVGVLPAEAHSGNYAFWSNKGDESDMALTRSFDFRDHNGPLTLTYWTWYDLEEDYDYLYLEVSMDGEHWQILSTPSGTPEDPSGNSYGWGYNGLSGGDGRWIKEEVDLSQYSGEHVQIRFEYITDAAVNGEGFLLDDISIPEMDYFSDFEADSGGWDAAGFVRINNVLPQTFKLAVLRIGDNTEIEYIHLSMDKVANIPLEIGDDVDEVIFVVTGTTRFTRQKAAYRFEIIP